MTLIITEVSRLGIAMVADIAVTIDESGFLRVENSVKKLHIVPQLQAGLSIWGNGIIPVKGQNIDTDQWVKQFIEENIDIIDVDKFSNKLAGELQKIFPNTKEPLGLHLAGYKKIGKEVLPYLYHIRNVDGPFYDLQIHDFIVGKDFEEKPESPFILRNGDFGIYANLFYAIEKQMPDIKKRINIDIPEHTLAGRVLYHKAFVSFVSDLYESAGLLRTISNPVDGLSITSDGKIELFEF